MSLAENEGEPNLGYHVLLRALGARPQWGGGGHQRGRQRPGPWGLRARLPKFASMSVTRNPSRRA